MRVKSFCGYSPSDRPHSQEWSSRQEEKGAGWMLWLGWDHRHRCELLEQFSFLLVIQIHLHTRVKSLCHHHHLKANKMWYITCSWNTEERYKQFEGKQKINLLFFLFSFNVEMIVAVGAVLVLLRKFSDYWKAKKRASFKDRLFQNKTEFTQLTCTCDATYFMFLRKTFLHFLQANTWDNQIIDFSSDWLWKEDDMQQTMSHVFWRGWSSFSSWHSEQSNHRLQQGARIDAWTLGICLHIWICWL